MILAFRTFAFDCPLFIKPALNIFRCKTGTFGFCIDIYCAIQTHSSVMSRHCVCTVSSSVVEGNVGECRSPKYFVGGTPLSHLLSGHGGTLIQ